MDAKDIISNLIEIIMTKKLELAVSMSYNDISINGMIYLDFVDSFKVKADLSLLMNGEKYNAQVYFIDKTIYLDVNNIHGSIKLDTILSFVDNKELTSIISNFDIVT